MLGIQVTDPWALVLLIISVAVSCALLIYWVVPWVVNKKFPVNDLVGDASNALKKIETILCIVGKNDPDGKYTDKLQLYKNIIEVTKNAVHAAEQLYKTKELNAEDRKSFAIEYTKKALQSSGVIMSHDIEDLIRDSIEASVSLMNRSANTTQVQSISPVALLHQDNS